MSDYTKHLRLIKPGGNDYYNIDDFNQNSELIDKETEKLSNAVTEIKNGATREKAGIVQFGTEEGKALEGMMLARLAGCVGYGGDIQEPGVKDINYLYYDRNTRKMYKCINQNSDVSASVANFVPLDNNSLFERLENLYKDFVKSGNWYYKQISSNFYMLFGWFQDVPIGESYYNLPISTVSEYTNSIVLSAQTGTGGERTITSYIKNRKIYLNNLNRTRENYSILAIVQI